MKRKILLTFAAVIACTVCSAAQTRFKADDGKTTAIGQKKNDNVTLGVCGIEFNIAPNCFSMNIPCSRKSKTDRNRYYSSHLGLFELGFNIVARSSYDAYPDTEKGFIELNTGKSTQINLNLLSTSLALNRAKTLGVVMAMGLQFNNYRFAEPVTLRKTGGMIHPEPIDTETTNYKKSKFISFGIWVPVLIEAAIANEFFIAAGVYGSLNMCDHTKYSSPKHKLHGIYAAPLTGGVTARIGFKKVYVMGNYNLSSLFQKDKGPEINMLSVGFGVGF